MVCTALDDREAACLAQAYECREGDAPTKLEFSDTSTSYSNLGGRGPDLSEPEFLRVSDVGTTAAGASFDLYVSATSSYEPSNSVWNRVNDGNFGIINVKAGTKVDLMFEFIDSSTGEAIEIPQFLTFASTAFVSGGGPLAPSDMGMRALLPSHVSLPHLL